MLSALTQTPFAAALRVFISYSRLDLAKADRMVADLERNGFAVVIDRRDLPYGEEWQKELSDLIANSDAVVWLVSPASTNSRWVNWELGEVIRLSKRLLPVKIIDIDPESLPGALGSIHLLPSVGTYEPALHEADLVRTLNEDRAWLKKATALASDAREWVATNRDGAHLLRGRALIDAERWTARPRRDEMAPAAEVLELILASRRAQDIRRRFTVAVSITVAAVGIALAAAAMWFGLRAEEQAWIAMRNESTALSTLSTIALQRGRPLDATMLALSGWPTTSHSRPATRMSFAALAAAMPSLGASSVLFSAAEWAAFTADGSYLLVITSDGLVRRIEVASLAVRTTFRIDGKLVSAAISPDGMRLAVQTHQGEMSVWSTETESKISILTGAGAYVFGDSNFSFCPDGQLVAARCEENAACIWSSETGTLQAALRGHVGAINSITYSRDGTVILTASDDKAVTLWDASTGLPKVTLRAENTREMSWAAFSPDGRWIAAAAWTDVVLWDAATLALVGRDSHADDIYSAAFSPDGTFLVTGSEDGTARIWMTGPSGVEPIHVERYDASVTSVMFSPDGRTILAASADGTVRLTDAATGLAEQTVLGSAASRVTAVISADGSAFITLDETGHVHLWKGIGTEQNGFGEPYRQAPTFAVTDDQSRRLLETDKGLAVVDRDGTVISELAGDPVFLARVTFSPDGAYLLGRDFLGETWLWRSDDGTIAVSLGETSEMVPPVFSPQGGTFALARGAEIHLYRTTTQEVMARFNVQGPMPLHVFFSQDGQRLGVALSNQTVQIWELASSALESIEVSVETIEPPSEGSFVHDPYERGFVVFAAFARQDNTIVMLSASGVIGIIDLSKNNAVTKFRSTLEGPVSAILSSDGERLHVVDLGRVRSIDLSTGIQIGHVRHFGNPVPALRLSADHKRILIPTLDGVRIWSLMHLESGNAFEVACERLAALSAGAVRDRYALEQLMPTCGENAPLSMDLVSLQ